MHSQFTALVARLGLTQARQELRWLKQALKTDKELTEAINRRLNGEPLQYVIGNQPFGPLTLLTRPPTLIPRPETEDWVLRLAKRFKPNQPCPPKRLLDLGTGSGCIPLLLCHLYPQGTLRAHGIDISPEAIKLASDNAAHCGIPLANELQEPDLDKNTFEATLASYVDPSFPTASFLKPPYDIITSNPPYIPTEEYLNLPHEVVAYEDKQALWGGPTGLDFYHKIAGLLKCEGFTRPGALVALEVGHNQAKEVEDIIIASGKVESTEIWKDPWDIQRTVVAQLSS